MRHCFDEQHLTQREYEVLHMVGKCYPTKLIAPALGIASKTVEKYRESLCRKLDCHSTTELVLAAVRLGAIEVTVTPLVMELRGERRQWSVAP